MMETQEAPTPPTLLLLPPSIRASSSMSALLPTPFSFSGHPLPSHISPEYQGHMESLETASPASSPPSKACCSLPTRRALGDVASSPLGADVLPHLGPLLTHWLSQKRSLAGLGVRST